MEFEKNPNYYDNASTKVDKIVYKFISDSGAALNAFKNGEIDFSEITTEQAKEFKDSPKLIKKNDGSVSYIILNTKDKSKVLSNAKIRKTISIAINKDELINTVLIEIGRASCRERV